MRAIRARTMPSDAASAHWMTGPMAMLTSPAPSGACAAEGTESTSIMWQVVG